MKSSLRKPVQMNPKENCLLIVTIWGWNIYVLKYVGKHSNFKKILRTRKIMVMHSNKREECCLRTIVDGKRERYDNAVDVVVRLHDRPILVPKVRNLCNLHTFSSVTSHELTI